jgi:hypothetical protein
MAWRLAGNDDPHRGSAAVHSLVLLTCGDLDSFASTEQQLMTVDLEGQLSIKDKEELAGMNMRVTYLAGARRHELFDDAKLGRLDEVPAVAVRSIWTTPLIVFGGFCVDDLRHSRSFLHMNSFDGSTSCQ